MTVKYRMSRQWAMPFLLMSMFVSSINVHFSSRWVMLPIWGDILLLAVHLTWVLVILGKGNLKARRTVEFTMQSRGVIVRDEIENTP
jgi:hypothetical protein